MADFRPFSPRWGDISFTEAPQTTARCYAGAIFLSYSPSGRHREPAGVEGAGGSCRGAGGRWRGLAELRGDAPSEARSADGSRAGRRPPAHTAAGPSGTRNTRGAPSNNHPGTPKGRVPKYPPLTQPLPRRGSGRMILSPGDGDVSTGTCHRRRQLSVQVGLDSVRAGEHPPEGIVTRRLGHEGPVDLLV